MAPIPKAMFGVVIPRPGGPDVLEYKTDLPVPSLGDGQILVRNEYIGINYIDTYFRTGLYKPPSPSSKSNHPSTSANDASSPYPLITGKEAAGTITASTHPSYPVDSRVVYLADATYAQYTLLSSPTTQASILPASLTPEVACAAYLQGLTALTFIREAAGIHQQLGISEGPWTLVHAAAGGTGSMLVQILAVMGAKIIATAGGRQKCELAKKLGAGWVVDSSLPQEEVIRQIKEITSGKGVDVIFDGVGKATFGTVDLDVVARKGTIIVFGNASGAVEPVDLFRLMPKNIKIMRPSMPGYITTPEEREGFTTELFDLLVTGKIHANIHHVYPLKDVAQAHIDLESRKTTGKLLLKVE
ncbi:putative quinone oxidoreductase [Triangularia verruculosa]|uniref:Quinone oxidoreductase n=1 Tax=Triangularia verruculosa TaxID=2587418 RepID=A0AAN7APF0_9PEZI|nr:putative quinone oxidoreductase [Triangularia verruculosa]